MSQETTKKLDLATLQSILNGDAAAIRKVTRLQPAGGPGDKVFPPTYEKGTYATETRVMDGQRVECVILDSVQSQANRMEMALLEAHREKRVQVPLVTVDFNQAGLPEVGEVTSLEAPHRLADAILRDGLSGGQRFRLTAEGKELDSASVSNATGLFGLCPTGLVLGLWDSTGPRGGLGTKFQRAVVSEVFGVDCVVGRRQSSRIDPLGIQLNAGPLYVSAADEQDWTRDEGKAKRDSKGKAVKVGKEGKPSEANHGNVTPTIEDGGVTMTHARQSVVLSLPALRRLRFPVDNKVTVDRDNAARTCLAALALCAATLSHAKGMDLRSRCLLVPEPGQGGWEVVGGDGQVTTFSLTASEACDLLKEAVAAAKTQQLPWREQPLTLKPSPGLVELVKKSRELAMQSSAEE
jgi:CRISPR-associated protein Csb1